MFIVDSQVHVWLPNSPERPWVGRHPHVEEPLTPDALIKEMDAAGVARAILVPPSWDNDRNDLVVGASERHPDRFAAMGRLDTEAPDSPGKIAGWTKQPGMLGLRSSFNRAPWLPSLVEGRVEWLWDEAEKADVPMMLMVTHQQIPLIDKVAERHPNLRIALCHLSFQTGKKGEEAFRDFDMLLPIAKRPNVMVKVSALPSYAEDGYPYRSLHPYIRKAYDAFGPQRMFWGTDLSILPCSYKQSIAMFTEEMPWLSSEDLEWIMGRGISKWLRWDMPKG
jgi:L-fuconolactonase